MRIVAFPFQDRRKVDRWGARGRDQHLLEHLAKNAAVERLLIVDRPVSLAERIVTRRPATARGAVTARRRFGRAHATLTTIDGGASVLDIAVPDLVAPALQRRGWWFEIFGRDVVLDAIRWAAERVTGERPDVIAWTPTAAPAVAALEPARFVFDSLDNWIDHPHLRSQRARAEAAYGVLLPRATRVVASAPRTRDVLARWAPDVEVIPNGVDVERFGTPAPRPDDLGPGPICGYAGILGPRIDARLVVDTARRLPDVTFAFVGASLHRPTSRALRSAPNVRLLGDRHYARLPAYVRAFDIAWIPHAVGEGESGGDPIKMYEYWAAGRQVVATPIDGLDAWAHQLHLVTGAASAASAIGGLLAGSVPPLPTVVPSDRRWQAIAGRLVELLRAGRAA